MPSTKETLKGKEIMFGAKPGEERFQGALNQYVVTKLSGAHRSYYVLHTRGEDPSSILIAEFTKLKTSPDDLHSLISSITERHMFSSSEWFAASSREVIAWGSEDKRVFLKDEITKSKLTSSIIGYEKGEARATDDQ